MPVFKYKTFEEAKKALWSFHPDALYFKQLAELWYTANKLCPIIYPQGVFKYRSTHEAGEHRKQWELLHARKISLQRDANY
jgi:hypothetical protein